MSEDKIKVSIIVPVYNVEKYLDKCVQSLVNQTYKNIEILLIDDGSTDSSGAMCDGYAQRYDNIRVFHKPNCGLSSARNYAVPYVNGEYVAYVDSDDYVEPYYIEYLMKPILENTSERSIDMVICKSLSETEEGQSTEKDTTQNLDTLPILYMTQQAALEAMCYGKMGTSACKRLIATPIIKKVSFPNGKIYEDLATMFRMIGLAQNIVFMDLPMYHYILRRGSITHSTWSPAVWDVMDAAKELLLYIDLNYPALHIAGVNRFFSAASEFYIRAFNEHNYIEIIAPLRKELVQLLPEVVKNKKLPLIRKIQCVLMAYMPRLYRCLRQLYKLQRGL